MSGTAADFPGLYPVLIGTKSFAVNTSYEAFRRQSFHHDTIPSQRESIDLTTVPGEGTINTEGLWRRGQISWHHGGGQLYFDRKGSDNLRWLYSLGVDPWSENQLTLLPATVQRVSDTPGGGVGPFNWSTTEVAGGYVYHLQGNANPGGSARVRFTQDYVTFTTPTGLPSTNIFALATDGTNMYAAGNGGVYRTALGGASWTQIVTDNVNHIWYVADRLIVDTGNQVWDITACTGAAQALAAGNAVLFMQHQSTSWEWLDFTAGESFIYGVGVNGNPTSNAVGESKVYQFSINPGVGGLPTGVNLTSGLPALRLEKGEFAGTIYGYGGYIFVGTNLGIRCCRTISQYDPSGNAGDLIAGPLLPNLTQPTQAPFQPYIGNFVSGIIGYGRFVWFSWPQFTFGGTTYWALGRLDLGNFLAPLQPAYASDLTVTSSVTSVNSHHTLNWDPVTNGPLMIVPSTGLYTQDYNVSITTGNKFKYVHQGFLRSGRITYDMQDNKTVAQANLKSLAVNAYAPFDAAGGTVALSVAYDGGSFASLAPLAPNTQANPPTLISPLTQAEEIEIEAVLTAGALSNTDDSRPFLGRWTVKALPNVVSGVFIYVALMLYVENDIEGAQDYSDPYGDYAYLENLRLAQTIIDYKEGSAAAGATQFAAKVVVQELYWMPHKKRENADGGYEGDLVVTLKSIVG